MGTTILLNGCKNGIFICPFCHSKFKYDQIRSKNDFFNVNSFDNNADMYLNSLIMNNANSSQVNSAVNSFQLSAPIDLTPNNSQLNSQFNSSQMNLQFNSSQMNS